MERLYTYRFEIFFASQIAILFGSLIVPSAVFDGMVAPAIFLINLLAGILLANERKLSRNILAMLLVTSIAVVILEIVNENAFGVWRMLVYFAFYILVTFELIRQVWQAKIVDKKVIYGLVSGYVSLGLMAFFICLSIEMLHPNSFSGLREGSSLTENLMYYSYITLMTIGYGDIVPVTSIAQKAAILIGLMGQVYLVVITAIIVSKYVSQNHLDKGRP